MKRALKLSVFTILVALLVTLTSCGGISQKYADKIKKAAKDGEPISYSQIEKKLGTPTVDARLSTIAAGTGTCIWIKGVSAEKYAKILEEVQNGNEEAAKQLDGKKTIEVIFTSGKAKTANYYVYNSNID